MKIVVLDGFTLNPGDLSWSGLEALGETTVFDRTNPEDIIARASGAEILFTNKTPLTAATMDALPELKFIGVLATGYNVVDVNAAKERGIPVSNIPTYGTLSVAQMVFAHIMQFCHHVKNHDERVKAGAWSDCVDFCFWDFPLIELAGKTLGVIGFGRIGQQTANIGEAFGMKILAFDAYKTDQSHRPDFAWAELDQLLKESDFVSLHCPLFPETQGIINKENLAKMKPTAFLVNTSRGPLIVDQDLADALNSGVIAGAGLDVLSVEPPTMDNPLMTAKNCTITPHIAWATKDARSRLMDIAVENAQAYIAGSPKNTVWK